MLGGRSFQSRQRLGRVSECLLKYTGQALARVVDAMTSALTFPKSQLRAFPGHEQVGTAVPKRAVWSMVTVPSQSWKVLPSCKQKLSSSPQGVLSIARGGEIESPFPKFPSDERISSPGSHRGLANIL